MVLLRLFFAALFLIPVFGGLTGLPASAETARPTGDPTKVHISIFVLDVDGINNEEMNNKEYKRYVEAFDDHIKTLLIKSIY